MYTETSASYDAFLSYSWKSDKAVALAIQIAIHRFLCPWYKLRSKNVFRDLSCLPAGSSLYAELFGRLDRSNHLIILASPDAAISNGMEIEAKHWFERPRDGQVLVVVTDGHCQTSDDVRTYLPKSARLNLKEDPLWVSVVHRRASILRDPHSQQVSEELTEDLKQILLRFYPGLDWGQLRGEERQRRRRALSFLTAIILLLIALAGAAIGFAVYAKTQLLVAESRALFSPS